MTPLSSASSLPTAPFWPWRSSLSSFIWTRSVHSFFAGALCLLSRVCGITRSIPSLFLISHGLADSILDFPAAPGLLTAAFFTGIGLTAAFFTGIGLVSPSPAPLVDRGGFPLPMEDFCLLAAGFLSLSSSSLSTKTTPPSLLLPDAETPLNSDSEDSSLYFGSGFDSKDLRARFRDAGNDEGFFFLGGGPSSNSKLASLLSLILQIAADDRQEVSQC
mmetsp:Transcript_21676/g.51026  ORF Transcript_21676/g.51026 Transcript_21676/m.51026 type:complete len:218 (+) Transcript_21676:346-999(+)